MSMQLERMLLKKKGLRSKGRVNCLGHDAFREYAWSKTFTSCIMHCT